jgi:DNA-binding transcriptional MerR regulator
MSRKYIAAGIDKAPSSARFLIEQLRNKGYIGATTHRDAKEQGYLIDLTDKAIHLLERSPAIFGLPLSDGRPVCSPTNLEEEKKEKETSSSNSNHLLIRALNDPELTYWREQGLDLGHVKQIQARWPHKTSAEILNSFRQARWHFEEEGFLPGRGGSPLNYVMGALLKTGGYGKRPGYKSPEDIEIAALEEELRRKQEQRKQIKELKEQLNRIDEIPAFDELYREQGDAFEKMLEWIKQTDQNHYRHLDQQKYGSQAHREFMALFYEQYIGVHCCLIKLQRNSNK